MNNLFLNRTLHNKNFKIQFHLTLLYNNLLLFINIYIYYWRFYKGGSNIIIFIIHIVRVKNFILNQNIVLNYIFLSKLLEQVKTKIYTLMLY